MVKFDEHFDVEAIYYLHRHGLMTAWRCTCKRAEKSATCRHRTMLVHFLNEKKVDTGWFYNYDQDTWERPANDVVRVLKQKQRRER